jgi:hypothetical protein
LHGGTRQRHPPDAQQLGRVKMHAHAEHEQDHANVGHLRGDATVSYESGRMRPDGNPSEQVPDEA